MWFKIGMVAGIDENNIFEGFAGDVELGVVRWGLVTPEDHDDFVRVNGVLEVGLGGDVLGGR